jgi:hypothetical protein
LKERNYPLLGAIKVFNDSNRSSFHGLPLFVYREGDTGLRPPLGLPDRPKTKNFLGQLLPSSTIKAGSKVYPGSPNSKLAPKLSLFAGLLKKKALR